MQRGECCHQEDAAALSQSRKTALRSVYSIFQTRESCKTVPSGLSGGVGSLQPAAKPGSGPGSQLPARGPRRASGYPGAGVSRPIGARGDSALTAVPGDRWSDIIDNTFLSPCFTPALCTCGDMTTI